MLLKEIEEKIAEKQLKFKDLEKYPLLIEVCEPGQSGYKPRKDSLVVCPLMIKSKETSLVIKPKDYVKPYEDYMGVYPFTCVIMESSLDAYKAGDFVQVNPQALLSSPTVVINGAAAIFIYENSIYGIDKNFLV